MFMILYHGTSQKKGKKILNDGMIRVSNPENSHHHGLTGLEMTTYGYVYLASSESKALQYGLAAAASAGKRTAYIFEVNINVDKLVTDNDECDIQRISECRSLECTPCNAQNCINKIESVRYPANLQVGIEVTRYKVIKVSLENREIKTTLQQCWTSLSANAANPFIKYFKGLFL